MSERRNVIRKLARERRCKRRDLVHAAGCVMWSCVAAREDFCGDIAPSRPGHTLSWERR